MSQSTTSDLVSTIATQLNIVIVALRLLVDMIQNPGATSSVEMTPGSCPSRPPASPASPPFRTTTVPSISWAPCEQTAPSLTRQKTPSPTMTMTSSAGKRTPLTHLPSPTFGPLPSPFTPLSSPVPSPSLPAADGAAPSSPPPLSFPPSPALSPPDFAYPPPSSLAPPLAPPPSPSCSLVSSAPHRKRRPPSPSPSLSPSPCHHSDTSWDDDWSTKDDDLLLSLKCNERLRPSWRYITTKMQRPESQIRARWAELLELQRLATS